MASPEAGKYSVTPQVAAGAARAYEDLLDQVWRSERDERLNRKLDLALANQRRTPRVSGQR